MGIGEHYVEEAGWMAARRPAVKWNVVSKRTVRLIAKAGLVGKIVGRYSRRSGVHDPDHAELLFASAIKRDPEPRIALVLVDVLGEHQRHARAVMDREPTSRGAQRKILK